MPDLSAAPVSEHHGQPWALITLLPARTQLIHGSARDQPGWLLGSARRHVNFGVVAAVFVVLNIALW
jgi:hypothetical protein